MYAIGLAVPGNDSEAVRLLRLAAEQGEALAQFHLASAYASGSGVSYDPIEAYKWFELSGDSDDDESRIQAINSRDAMSVTMAAEEVGLAIARVKEWRPRSGSSR